MTRLSILVGDGPGSVNGALLATMLGRWAERAGVDVTVEVVSAASYPTALADAEDARRRPRRRRRAGVATSRRAPAPPIPTVYVDLSFDGSHGRALDGRVVFGRGVDTYVWAATHVAAWLRWPPVTVRYGDQRDQFGELRTPDRPGPHPVVVLVHGGFWRAHWELDLMDDLAIDLAAAGLGLVEHRVPPRPRLVARRPRRRRRGRRSPRLIADDHDLAIDRTALVGHSAGGHLVLWAGGRRRHGPVAEVDGRPGARRAAGSGHAISSTVPPATSATAAAEFLGAGR